ncbi:DUF805 domain-containing protein [Neiella marina]|uniref:DUF805 domain-containing protein n=1 Tax=Neiella holothuriorum TaxID=2870530 RepID=A0ABS7ECA8_9GAMM|nr:DUF805 domain-containing protein [Neiella holothuriorum]MBW8189962.1 DUF805 domain-containing protein [Neiella holothuriorum]
MNYVNWLLFSFRGRINRKTFWLFQIAMLVVVTLLLMALGGETLDQLADNPNSEEAFNALMALAWKINIVLLWPKLAIDIKRFQDRNRSWYWVLIQLIPMIGPIWYLVEAGFLPGTRGPNRFGPSDPNQPNQDSNNNDSGHFEA